MRLNGSMGRVVHHSQRPHASIQQDSAPVLKDVTPQAPGIALRF